LNSSLFDERLASDLTGIATRKIVPIPMNAYETVRSDAAVF